ncbi:MAG TPA: CHASE domain-containing protein [Burkholderiales bacterium]|nr:CHASE domain-containing protein [Burkholderiales bacterium]
MTDPEETPSQRTRRWAVLPWLVLLIGVPASIYLFVVLNQAVEEVARSRFEREASEAKGLIEVRIHFYADILYGLRALFATQPNVSRLDFHRYVRSLDLKQRYPGFDLVNFAAYVPGRERARFEAAVRRDVSLDARGYPDFAIKPPGERPDYHVMVYLEPMQDFRFAFGLDLGANPALDAAPKTLVSLQHSARDSGRLTASGMPIRIKGAKEYVGLAMRLAVYRAGAAIDTVEQRRAAYVGSVGAGFNVEHLMKGTLHEGMAQYMRFILYDAGSASDPRSTAAPVQERLLFDSDPRKGAAGEDHDAFTRVLPIEVGGRIWRIHFKAPRSALIEKVDALSPWVVLVGGILTSLLLAGLFYSLASSRGRALAIASEMTSHLRESEASLTEAHALLADAQKLAGVGCCHYEPGNGRIVWSEELFHIHGVDPGTFAPTYESTMALVHPEDRSSWARALERALASGAPFSSEFRIVRPDRSVRHLRSLGEVMHDGGGTVTSMLWSVLDITEQKRTEDALRASAEQLTALSRRLVEVQEAERRQLSRELHDRVGQNLTALSINLDMLRTSLGDANAKHAARLRDSTALLESTADSIEDVMSELRPPMLDDYGLYPALNWYARRFAERTGIEVEVFGSDTSERPRPEIEITLFRIAQEALTNVAKHAEASRVRIDLTHANGHCVMRVADNGIGIDTARLGDIRERRGLGMVTMRERTQAVGGHFTASTVPGGGTEIAIEVPVHDDTHTHSG